MSGRVIGGIANGTRKISIILAEEVQDRGFKRIIDAIDPAIISQTAKMVATAFSGSTIMTAGQKSQANEIVIMYGMAQSRR